MFRTLVFENWREMLVKLFIIYARHKALMQHLKAHTHTPILAYNRPILAQNRLIIVVESADYSIETSSL